MSIGMATPGKLRNRWARPGWISELAQSTEYDQRAPDDGPNAAYLTGAVHRDELLILLVIHENDGDWQFSTAASSTTKTQ